MAGCAKINETHKEGKWNRKLQTKKSGEQTPAQSVAVKASVCVQLL